MKTILPESLQSLEGFFKGEQAALDQLNAFDHEIEKKRHTFLGYPCNGAIRLEGFLEWWNQSVVSQSPLNDVGNPENATWYSLNAHRFERTVLDYFSHLFSIPDPWGYITSGGTQGNEQGLYIGREVLKAYGSPILYFSEDAHYSIASLGKVLGVERRMIPSKLNGEMDENALARQLDTNRPALFSLSIGTTFKGAIDRIEVIDPIVKAKGIQHVYYHADAALFGGYLPFISDSGKPDLNFKKHPYDSIAVSGHKFFGSPVPLGIFLTRAPHMKVLEAEYIEYIHSRNVTIPCSRSSLNSLILWWIVTTTPVQEFIREAETMLSLTRYFYEELKKREYPVWLNPYSNTLYFKAPSLELSKHWTLSLFTCRQLGPLAHAIMMQHVDKKMIDQFLEELDKERTFEHHQAA